MVKHYNDLISSMIVKDKDYEFQNCKFGKSNTDQSFYEPMASMVQNAQKSGSVSSSLHNDAEKSIAEIRENSDFLPNNMTNEEIHAMIIHQREVAKSAIKDVNTQINAIKDEVSLRNEVVQNSSVSKE